MYLWLICVPCKNKINSFQLSIGRPENVIQKLAKLIFIEYYFTWRMDRCRLHFWQGWLLAAVQWILLFLQTPLPWLSTFNWINCNKRRSLRYSITHFKSTFRYKRCTITQETKNAETKIFLLNYLVDHCLWTGGTNKMRQGVCFGGGRTHSQVAQENQSSDFDRNLPAEMTVTQQSGRQIFSITNSLLVRFTFSLQSFWREIHKHRVKCIQIWGFSFGCRHWQWPQNNLELRRDVQRCPE